jgi:hypothetical protein
MILRMNLQRALGRAEGVRREQLQPRLYEAAPSPS